MSSNFKKTPFGFVPPNWSLNPLHSIVERVTEKNENRSENVLTISARDGLVNQKDYFNKSVASKNLSKYFYLRKGDFAYNKSYSKGYPYGVIKMLEKYPVGVVSTLYICFRNKKKDVNNEFLKYLFESSLWYNEVRMIAKEGGRAHGLLNIGVKEFFDIMLPFPTIKEQQKIAAILTSVDEAIEKTEQIIEQTETVKKGLMQQLFTKGIKHTEFKDSDIGELPVSWSVIELSEVVEILDGQRKPIKKADRELIDGEIPYYGASGIIDWVNDFIFDEPLVLLAEDGENLKSRNLPIAFKIVGKTWVNNHAHVLRPTSINIDYLEYYLESIDYEKYISGSAQPKLNQQTIRKIKVAYPSELEQNKIASILNEIDEKLISEKKGIEYLNSLKQGLMQQLLTGRVRVPINDNEEVSS
ncbi:restriction endonuclease subunit S [Gracilibacillus dipsosauri]|uniref:Type I restriction modification DNA specificity domain-containing protein n=1 Tax=Gracilibacillus dipsosauri TaxID=178340 RepID=A0A317L249_9BACI|nr:restriction endonuclease subunit S [Gracilibacillus dipsosauri]PWU69951.1 hypothetical protein DLJ74_03230 [Gracilibacillus dipsosauri]